MKKTIVTLLAAVCTVFAAVAGDGFGFGVWFDQPAGLSGKDIEGIALGLPVVANDETEGASLALCGNNTQKMEGLQFTLFGFNYANSIEGVQLSFINMYRKQHGEFAMQWGFYNQSGENGIQLGMINHGKNNATFQLGLVNINKNGLLPIMIFVNFGKDLFDF